MPHWEREKRWGRDDEVVSVGRCIGGGEKGDGGALVGRIGERRERESERETDVM